MFSVGENKTEKMIAFTDSRDDAADLAAFGVHHYRDLVRQLIHKTIEKRTFQIQPAYISNKEG